MSEFGLAPFVTVLLVSASGDVREKNMRTSTNLHTVCGFKSAENFKKQTEWSGTSHGKSYVIALYGKAKAPASKPNENKYDFPPPADTLLLFGNALLVAYEVGNESETTRTLTHLTLEMWNVVYEALFGGFENLDDTVKEDECEGDELENIDADKKTKKGGYLKDGFVVDSSEDDISPRKKNAVKGGKGGKGGKGIKDECNDADVDADVEADDVDDVDDLIDSDDSSTTVTSYEGESTDSATERDVLNSPDGSKGDEYDELVEEEYIDDKLTK